MDHEKVWLVSQMTDGWIRDLVVTLWSWIWRCSAWDPLARLRDTLLKCLPFRSRFVGNQLVYNDYRAERRLNVESRLIWQDRALRYALAITVSRDSPAFLDEWGDLARKMLSRLLADIKTGYARRLECTILHLRGYGTDTLVLAMPDEAISANVSHPCEALYRGWETGYKRGYVRDCHFCYIDETTDGRLIRVSLYGKKLLGVRPISLGNYFLPVSLRD